LKEKTLAGDISIERFTERFSDVTLYPALQERVRSSLREIGFFVLRDFLPPDDCDELVQLVDDTVEHRPEIVRSGSDKRIFGADVLDPRIQAFRTDAFLQHVGEHLIGVPQRSLLTLANRLSPVAGKPRRSGGDWHRDRLAPQFKALVYLSDVGPKNGPFSMLPQSNRIWPFGRIAAKTGFDFLGQRWKQSEFEDFQNAVQDEIQIFTAEKGTAVLFDSSNIHSGQPIVEGRRYALTNYYYSEWELDLTKMEKKFHILARPLSMPKYG
jgi:hypothetical protein